MSIKKIQELISKNKFDCLLNEIENYIDGATVGVYRCQDQ
jgi:hypothetical protein